MMRQRRMRRRSGAGGAAWAAVTVVCLSAAATGGALAGLIMQATADQAPSEVVPPIHREVPDDPYVAVPPDQRRTSPAFRAVTNGFASVQVNVDDNGDNIVGDAANEPSLAIDPTNPNLIAIGWRQFDTIQSNFRQAGWAYTTDGGRAWTFPGVIEPGVFRSDPVLDTDADGHFYYNSLTTEGGFHCDVFKSINGGQTWSDAVYAYGGDKAWMAIDRTHGIGHGNIYAAWDHAGCCGDDWFTRSTTGAKSFESPVPVPEQPIWGVTAVGPEGEVCIVGRRRTTNEKFVVAKSTSVRDPEAPLAFDFAVEVDLGGRHLFATGKGPNPGGLNGQVWIAFDHSGGPFRGNVYVLCSVRPFDNSDPLDVHFVRSTDGGVTWSDPVRVNDDAPHPNAWQWFGTMAVAPNGRIDVIWNDTRANLERNLSELFYAFSEDGGRTWSENIAVSPQFDSWVGWPNQNKIGDYYDMISDNGGASVAYAATFNNEQDVYYLRITDSECLADLDGDGLVGFSDLLAILAAWGNKGGPEDLDESGFVDIGDILTVLAAWGPCPETTGACCLDGGGCVEMITMASCHVLGGSYRGRGRMCTDCRFGACCLEDGTCTDEVTEDSCGSMGGLYQGNGSTCDAGCPVGACCFEKSCVDEVNELACGSIGGLYQGDGTNCLDTCLGACCLEDGTCTDEVTESSCGSMGGTYRGDGTTCVACFVAADDCADAPTVSDGVYSYSTLGATTDGSILPGECDEGNGVRCRKDVWIRYVASCAGTATASVCDSDFNTRIVVYEDGDCPGPFLACNDDACGVDGTRSEVSFPVQSGGTYLIRIGSPRFETGEGTLTIGCAG